MCHRFGNLTKLSDGVLVLGSREFSLLPQLRIASKEVLSDLKRITFFCLFKLVTHSVSLCDVTPILWKEIVAKNRCSEIWMFLSRSIAAKLDLLKRRNCYFRSVFYKSVFVLFSLSNARIDWGENSNSSFWLFLHLTLLYSFFFVCFTSFFAVLILVKIGFAKN